MQQFNGPSLISHLRQQENTVFVQFVMIDYIHRVCFLGDAQVFKNTENSLEIFWFGENIGKALLC